MFRVSFNTLTMIVFTRGPQFYYYPKKKFAKVMFLHLSVSHSIHSGGLHPRADLPPWDTMGYSQRAGGTHPSGMHSCSSMGATLGVTNTLQTDALFTHAHTFCLVKMPFQLSCKEVELLACLPLHFKR